jgi:hypothetical protein
METAPTPAAAPTPVIPIEVYDNVRRTAEASAGKVKDYDDLNNKFQAAETARQAAEARRDELEKKLRGRAHRDAFEAVADALKVKKDPSVRKALYNLAGWAEDSDEPDAKAMRKYFAPHVEECQSWALDGDEAPAKKPDVELEEDEETDKPDATAARGGGSKAPHGKFKVTTSQVRDPKWMRANQARYAEASASGNLFLVKG